MMPNPILWLFFMGPAVNLFPAGRDGFLMALAFTAQGWRI
jgi:hypothetical protein